MCNELCVWRVFGVSWVKIMDDGVDSNGFKY